MGKNTTQIKQSFIIAGMGYGVIVFLSCAIGVVVLSIHPGLDPNNVIIFILDNYSFEGLRGLTLIGIMAMVMSTADSWINSGAVIFAHDFCEPLGIKFKNELFLSRAFAVVGSLCALLLVLYNENFMKLMLLQANFYVPIVTAPLLLAMFGFRSTGRSVIIGMAFGAISVIMWKIYIQPTTGVDSVIPCMFLNAVALFFTHYFLGEPGGWVGIKDDSDIKQARCERQDDAWNIKGSLSKIRNTNIINYCNRYIPKQEMTYIYFALKFSFHNL